MDLLGRARKLLKSWTPEEPPAPQYYNVSCPEGHVLRGLRTAGYQAIRCPSCGEGIFVLSASPLPEPPAARVRAPRRPIPAPLDDPIIPLSEAPPQTEVQDVVWLDEEGGETKSPPPEPLPDAEIPPEYRAQEPEIAPSESPPDDPTTRRLEVRRPSSKRPSRSEATEPPAPTPTPSVPPAGSRQIVLEPKGGLRSFAGRHRVALVLTGLVVAAAGTIYYRVRQAELEALPRIAREAEEGGLEALATGRFDEAKQKLAQAASALERLGADSEAASKARQVADEAAILADRCRLRLEELVEEAARHAPPEDWPSHFESNYQGQAIIIDSAIVETPGPSENGTYELAYRVLLGRGPTPSRIGRINLEKFLLFETIAPKVGQPVLFGARLESLTFEDDEWVIRLQPKSGVVLTRLDALEKAGWVPSQSARVGDDPEVAPERPQ